MMAAGCLIARGLFGYVLRCGKPETRLHRLTNTVEVQLARENKGRDGLQYPAVIQ